jgi:flap endonuclease-1
MGIKGLFKFLQDAAPKAVREVKGPEAFTGRTLAIDASMCLYQFLIIIREGHSGAYQNLTNQEGEVTSHIVGFITRTIRLMEAGIKPIYVFDGKPPELKLGELAARRSRRLEAEQTLEEAKESGDAEQILRSTKMSVKVTKEHNEQAKKLLRLMGLPVVEAPSEAEATCAALCKAGKVYASATEDADCLTFGTSILIRNLLAAEAQKKPIYEVDLKTALQQLNISMDQFIDLCILCGCDYCDHLKGIGPSTAIKLLIQHGTLEKILETLDPAKMPVPENFRYQIARQFFNECESVDTSIELKWQEPDFEELKKFLVEENTFSEERVARYCERLRGAKSKTKQQPLSMFFQKAAPVIKDADKYDPNKKKANAAAKASAKAKAKAKAKSAQPVETASEAEPSTPTRGQKRDADAPTPPKKRTKKANA